MGDGGRWTEGGESLTLLMRLKSPEEEKEEKEEARGREGLP